MVDLFLILGKMFDQPWRSRDIYKIGGTESSQAFPKSSIIKLHARHSTDPTTIENTVSVIITVVSWKLLLSVSTTYKYITQYLPYTTTKHCNLLGETRGPGGAEPKNTSLGLASSSSSGKPPRFAIASGTKSHNMSISTVQTSGGAQEKWTASSCPNLPSTCIPARGHAMPCFPLTTQRPANKHVVGADHALQSNHCCCWQQRS